MAFIITYLSGIRMSSPKFLNFLKKKINTEQIDLTEARRLGHIGELGDLNHKLLRSQRKLSIVRTPTSKSTIPVNLKPEQLRDLRNLPLADSIIFKKLSYEDISEHISTPKDFQMAGFTIADFNRVIPEFKGDVNLLPVFLRRCDTFHDSLNDAGKISFLSHIIFKLSGKAFRIFEDKKYNDWPTLKLDLMEGIKVSKSASALQNELVNLTQTTSQSAKEFSEVIKEKLKELSDIIKSQYAEPEVIKSFRIEHEKIAIRAFKEGLKPPLKYRVVNFEPKSLDEIIKKAVEEEPYVAVLKSSLELKDLNKSQPRHDSIDMDWRQGRSNFQNSRQFHQNQRFDRFSSNRRTWRLNRSFENRPSTPFHSWRNSNDNENNRYNDKFTKQESYDSHSKKDFNFCIRCQRRGHTSDTCYAKLDNFEGKESTNLNDLSQKVRQVSFLEVPQTRRPVLGPNKPAWSDKTQRR